MNEKSTSQNQALEVALNAKDEGIVLMLIKTALSVDPSEFSYKSIGSLLATHATTAVGQSEEHYALYARYFEAALSCTNGPDETHFKNEFLQSALYKAVWVSHSRWVDWLLSAGNFSPENPINNQVMQVAFSAKDPAIMEKLIVAGGDINFDYGEGPIWIHATALGAWELLDKIWEYISEINAPNQCGNTGIHEFSTSMSFAHDAELELGERCLREFLRRGADPYRLNLKGQAPFEWIDKNVYPKAAVIVKQVLVDHCASEIQEKTSSVVSTRPSLRRI